MKLLPLSFALVLPAATPALAQAAWAEIAGDVTVTEFGETADKIGDWHVFAPDGTKIGEVDKVLGAAGKAAALSVDFDESSGYRVRDDVILPLDQFTFADGKLTLPSDAKAVRIID